jgi:hypothetical protein
MPGFKHRSDSLNSFEPRRSSRSALRTPSARHGSVMLSPAPTSDASDLRPYIVSSIAYGQTGCAALRVDSVLPQEVRHIRARDRSTQDELRLTS